MKEQQEDWEGNKEEDNAMNALDALDAFLPSAPVTHNVQVCQQISCQSPHALIEQEVEEAKANITLATKAGWEA